jgi:HEAT repeat protein
VRKVRKISSVVVSAATALTLALSQAASSQTLGQRVTQSDGVVDVIYPSRPSVCGDGAGLIKNLFGRSMSVSDNSTFSGHGSWSNRPCERGPARIAVSVASGEVTRLRAYVGPTRAAAAGRRTVEASAADASAWLSALIDSGTGRIPSEAMIPLILADGPEPWPLLLRVARDENRSRATRGSALLWLANGVNDKLGLGDDDAQSDDDEMRQEAVFVLSQRPKGESVPELIDLAKHGKYPSVRRSAIFWLGQTGDPRAVDTYAELLAGK